MGGVNAEVGEADGDCTGRGVGARVFRESATAVELVLALAGRGDAPATSNGSSESRSDSSPVKSGMDASAVTSERTACICRKQGSTVSEVKRLKEMRPLQ